MGEVNRIIRAVAMVSLVIYRAFSFVSMDLFWPIQPNREPYRALFITWTVIFSLLVASEPSGRRRDE